VPGWDLHDLGADGGEHGVKRGGELGVAVADQVPESLRPVVQVHQQVAGLLCDPLAGGVGGDPGGLSEGLCNG
jgi:hypothetical protein